MNRLIMGVMLCALAPLAHNAQLIANQAAEGTPSSGLARQLSALGSNSNILGALALNEPLESGLEPIGKRLSKTGTGDVTAPNNTNQSNVLQTPSTAGTAVGVPLWRGLVSGVDAGTLALQLQKFPEIKKADARLKKDKPPELKIKYNPAGITLFNLRMNLDFKFEEGSLSDVILASESVCNDNDYKNNLVELGKGLIGRYPKKLRVVTPDGQESEDQLGFTDGITQVIVTIEATAPPTEYEVADANLDAALARAKGDSGSFSQSLAASRLARTRLYAMAACPGTKGIMGNVSLRYSSLAQSIKERTNSRIQEEERNRQDKSKL